MCREGASSKIERAPAADMGGRSKRKTISPLQKDSGKSRRTVEEEAVSEAEEDSRNRSDMNGDLIADLKKVHTE